MSELLGRMGQPASTLVERRHEWRELEVVTRRIDRTSFSLAAALAPPARLPATQLHLRCGGVLHLDAPFAAASGGPLDGWKAAGRLLPPGGSLTRSFRVLVEIGPWSGATSELRVVPRSRRAMHRWGRRRLRLYWNIAHDAADQLAQVLSSARLAEPTPDRTTTPHSFVAADLVCDLEARQLGGRTCRS